MGGAVRRVGRGARPVRRLPSALSARNFGLSPEFYLQNTHICTLMPILLWLLGVPLTLVIILMLAGVV